MKLNGIHNVSIDQWIRQIDQYDAWQKLIGFRPELGKRICNPLRLDRHPGAWFAEYDGKLILVDFAYFSRHTDVFEAYKLSNKVLLPQTSLSGSITENNNFQFKLEFTSRPYTKNDAAYWKDYGISIDQLEEEDVYAVDQYWHNSRLDPDNIRYHHPADECYSIVVDDKYKIYRPKNPIQRFLTNFDEKTIGGNSKLNENEPVIYTKSFKDYRVLVNLGYTNSRYVNSETNRYLPDGIYIYDNDDTGKQNIEYINKHTNSKGFVCPLSKDVALSYLEYGADVLKRSLDKLLNQNDLVMAIAG